MANDPDGIYRSRVRGTAVDTEADTEADTENDTDSGDGSTDTPAEIPVRWFLLAGPVMILFTVVLSIADRLVETIVTSPVASALVDAFVGIIEQLTLASVGLLLAEPGAPASAPGQSIPTYAIVLLGAIVSKPIADWITPMLSWVVYECFKPAGGDRERVMDDRPDTTVPDDSDRVMEAVKTTETLPRSLATGMLMLFIGHLLPIGMGLPLGGPFGTLTMSATGVLSIVAAGTHAAISVRQADDIDVQKKPVENPLGPERTARVRKPCGCKHDPTGESGDAIPSRPIGPHTDGEFVWLRDDHGAAYDEQLYRSYTVRCVKCGDTHEAFRSVERDDIAETERTGWHDTSAPVDDALVFDEIGDDEVIRMIDADETWAVADLYAAEWRLEGQQPPTGFAAERVTLTDSVRPRVEHVRRQRDRAARHSGSAADMSTDTGHEDERESAPEATDEQPTGILCRECGWSRSTTARATPVARCELRAEECPECSPADADAGDADAGDADADADDTDSGTDESSGRDEQASPTDILEKAPWEQAEAEMAREGADALLLLQYVPPFAGYDGVINSRTTGAPHFDADHFSVKTAGLHDGVRTAAANIDIYDSAAEGEDEHVYVYVTVFDHTAGGWRAGAENEHQFTRAEFDVVNETDSDRSKPACDETHDEQEGETE